MARAKTKKQKKAADLRVVAPHVELPQVELPKITKMKSPATVFTQSQVHLLYKDLIKTAVVTGVIAVVLLSIFLYMR